MKLGLKLYIIRVENLWFSNDTLVIRAENRMFRVSKSILAMRSPVFSDMVVFPQPTNGEKTDDRDEMIEGSPVVHLHDSGTAVEALLNAIFDSSYFMPPPAPIHTRALRHLAVAYGPSSVTAYRAPQQVDHIIYRDEFEIESECESLQQLRIIAAAIEVGALWLLPVAYYLAASKGTADLRSALQLGAQKHHVQTCLTAQGDLVRGSGRVWSFLSAQAYTCTARQSCTAILLKKLRAMLSFFPDGLDLTPFDDWNSDEGWKTLKDSLCTFCFANVKSEFEENLSGLWDLLPEFFGLPGWPELHALRAAALEIN
ncbi:hypothetical protein C8R43DRAFT_1228861 [Mycena crocata]|nr:hypothetical protein C8R43DRAFT_1228861 [Mycena crocata]